MFVIEEELKKLPQKPGVYLMHDAQDNIIYVGKAIRLRSRVQSYFREKINRGPQIEKMVTQIARFEYIVTDSELEALVLENNLIKEHNPKYNTLLKDDKTYPYIKVTVGEAYPRVQFSRLMKKDKSKYFGPFTSAAAVKDTIELLNKLFKLRTCNRVLPRDCGLERPCLNYHIGQCMAPCQDYVSREEYRAHVDKALEFLNGNYNMILNDLQKKMEEAAEALEFEEAARYRDLFNSVKQVSQKQKITDSDGEDKDIIALDKDGSDAVVQVFFVRGGKLIGREHFYMTHVEDSDKAQILLDFVNGDIDVLVSTTIIETGLDIPNANTMIIQDADRMGLSQLYQLRGRVGRSSRTSYAFLMYKRDKLLKEEAEKRLQAIREFTELGSGVKIAMRDLEIRGAGNVLGAEQHGHMEAVGYDLYCKLLNQAVQAIQGRRDETEDFASTVECDVDAYIPVSYIKNEYQKLDVYKRISGIENEEEYLDMQDELMDRFGDIPKAVANLLQVALLKAMAHRAYVTEVRINRQEIRLTMYPNAKLNTAGIPELVASYGDELLFVMAEQPYFLYVDRRNRQKDCQAMMELARTILGQIIQLGE